MSKRALITDNAIGALLRRCGSGRFCRRFGSTAIAVKVATWRRPEKRPAPGWLVNCRRSSAPSGKPSIRLEQRPPLRVLLQARHCPPDRGKRENQSPRRQAAPTTTVRPAPRRQRSSQSLRAGISAPGGDQMCLALSPARFRHCAKRERRRNAAPSRAAIARGRRTAQERRLAHADTAALMPASALDRVRRESAQSPPTASAVAAGG
jgi:hypothetical protein